MAQIVDPWGGYFKGIENLNQSLSDIRRQKMENLELESRGIQNKAAAAQLQDLLLKQNQNEELRKSMANAQPETVTDTQFVPSAVNQPSPAIDMLNRMPGQQPAPVEPFTPPVTPTDASQNPSVFNTPGEIKTTTTEVAPNKTKMAIDYWESVGNLDKANAIRSDVAKQAKELVDATGNPMAGIEHLNKNLGTNYQTMKMHSYEILKSGDQPVAIFDKGMMDALQMSGASPSEAATKAMIPLNLPGGNGQIVSEFLAKNPNPTPQQMWELANKHNIPLKQIEPIITEIQRTQAEENKNIRQEKQFRESEERQARQFAHSDAVQARALRAIAERSGQAPDEIKTLAQQIVNKQLDPYAISKRAGLQGKVFAQVEALSPGFNLNEASAIAKQMNAEARQRGGARTQNVDSAYKMFSQEAPELISLRNKVQAKGLLPGNITDINALNQWIGKKVSDPDVVLLQKKTKFLADSLQRTIGGTQGGQWAFEVAADILNPTYSPQAFAGIVNSHKQAMLRMRDALKSFGKDNAPPTGKDPLGIL